MKLYVLEGSPNCRKAIATAYHVDKVVDIVTLDFFKKETRGEAFLNLNPNGMTPTLEDEGFILWESNAIMQYLADAAGAESLFPRDYKLRADIVRWQFWGTAHFGDAIGDILWEKFAKRLFTGGDTDQAALEVALQRFHRFAPILEKQLEKHDFVTGNTLTLADFSLACHSALLGAGEVPMGDYPALRAWYDRLERVDAWKASAPKNLPL